MSLAVIAVLALPLVILTRQEGEAAEVGVGVLQVVLLLLLLLNAIFLWLLKRMRVLLREDDACCRGPRSGGLF
jgi:hypothetical protein